MRSGLLTRESFSEVLRSISQARRQGVLSVGVDENSLEITFSQGRVVSAAQVGRTTSRVVWEFLLRGYPELASQLDEPPDHLGALFEGLVQLAEAETPWRVDFWTPATFAALVKHAMLEQLYALDLSQSAHYELKLGNSLIREKEFLPSISVGQLLLDLVGLEESRTRLSELYQGGQLISAQRSAGINPELTVDEERLLELLQEPISLECLGQRSLLSEAYFLECFLALHDRGMIQQSNGTSCSKEEQLTAGQEQLLAELESSLASFFVDECGEDLASVGTDKICSNSFGAPTVGDRVGSIRLGQGAGRARVTANLRWLRALNARVLADERVTTYFAWIVGSWCLLAATYFWRGLISI